MKSNLVFVFVTFCENVFVFVVFCVIVLVVVFLLSLSLWMKTDLSLEPLSSEKINRGRFQVFACRDDNCYDMSIVLSINTVMKMSMMNMNMMKIKGVD